MTAPNFFSLKSVLIFAVLGTVLVSGNESSKESEAVVAHLEKLAAGFPIDRFETDPLLIQKLDKANSVSKYYLPGEEKTVVYERNSDDTGKEVIVLKGEEDKLTFKKLKRIYVVLRKRPATDPEQLYFVNLAFLRVAKEKDTTNLIEVGGVKQAVEWVTFDEHVIPGHPSTTMKALHCASSFIAPCSFNLSALTPPENFISSPRFKDNAPSVVGDQILTSLMVEEGADPLDTYDLFEDMVPSKLHQGGRGLFDGGQEIGILGGVLSGVGGILCTIVSILASCADERAHGHLMSPALAASNALALNPVGSMLMGRRRRDASVTTADLEKQLDYPGWLTQFYAPKKAVTFRMANNLFYGLGNCPYVESGPTALKAATTNDGIVTFYLTKLRTNCIPWMKEFITKIIDNGLIQVRDKAFTINQTHPFVTETKLTLKELIQLTAAAELDAFSAVYVDTSTNTLKPMNSKSPDDKLIVSKSVNFIVNVGLKAIERMGVHSRSHMVHLLRNMHQTFMSIYTKLREDAQNLQRCPDDCKNDKQINYNDRVQILSLISFINYGVGSVVSGADAKNHYKLFYTKNAPTLEKVVAAHA